MRLRFMLTLLTQSQLCSQYFLVLVELLAKRLRQCAFVSQSHFNSRRGCTQVYLLYSD